jgi:hypothetical protein
MVPGEPGGTRAVGMSICEGRSIIDRFGRGTGSIEIVGMGKNEESNIEGVASHGDLSHASAGERIDTVRLGTVWVV